ncbi:SPASM domain-containing protein [Treponema sp.]
MSAETTELLVKRAFELDAQSYSFGFQGGEPTLAGLGFFELFTGLVKKYNTKNAPVHYALQTNGITIDAGWARFLKKEGFLLGVSIDGPRTLHDAFRVKRDDSGSYTEVMAGVAALRAEDVPVNALCVVDAAVADNVELVYRTLRRRGFDWIQFIPCLDPFGEEPGGQAWSLKPEAFTIFLKKSFDLWYEEGQRGTPSSVRWFDNLVGMAAGYPPENCGMAGRCSAYYTVEADGSVYPCDFYVTDEWRLGDIRTNSLKEMIESETSKRFVAVSEYVDTECTSCFAYPLCRGGCRRDREPFVDDKPVLNRYCVAYKEFFRYAGERIMALGRALGE